MDETEEVYFYPPNTPGEDSDNGNYLHRLSPQSKATLGIIQRWVIDNQINIGQLNPHSLHPTLTLLRYLRANGFDAQKTIDHMTRNIAWRLEHRVDDLVKMDPESILGCSMQELTSVFPHWHASYDKTGRPLLFKQYGKFDAARVKKLTGGSFDNLCNYHIWEQEMCLRLCTQQSHKRGVLVETFSAVMDLKDMKVSQITRDFLNMTKILAEIDEKQYPETLGRIFLINAPAAFPMVWRWVKPFLDPVVTTKIQVLGGPSEYQPVLFEHVGEDFLPSDYGGTLPPLSTDVHPYLENMAEFDPRRLEVSGDAALFEGRIEIDAKYCPPVDISSNSSNSENESLETSSDEDEFMDAKECAEDGASPRERRKSKLLQVLKRKVNKRASNRYLYGTSGSESGALLNSRSYRNWAEELNFLKSLDNLSLADELGYECSGNLGNCDPSLPPKGKGDLLENVSDSLLQRITPDSWFKNTSTNSLANYLVGAMILYMLCALAAISMGVVALSSTRWMSSLAKLQLWAGVLMVMVSTIMIIFNFIGYLSVRLKNRPLLLLYASGIFASSCIFTSVAIVSFLYYFVPQAAGIGNSALNSLPTTAQTLFKRYNLLLGIGSTVACVFGSLPFFISLVLAYRFKLEQGRFNNPLNIQIVLRVATVISFASSLVMIVYGGDSLKFLFSINYEPTLFYTFGLVYGGVAVFLSSAVGLWSSVTIHKSVLWAYYRVVLPILIISLFAIAALFFKEVQRSDRVVSQHYEYLNTSESESKIKIRITTQLLVAGVLALFVCVFQIASLIAARSLFLLLSSMIDGSAVRGGTQHVGIQKDDKGVEEAMFWQSFSINNFRRFYITHSRSRRERMIMVWAVTMGFLNLFVIGTFVVFSAGMQPTSFEGQWETSVWTFLGRADQRFVQNDSYLVTSSAVNSLAVGPLLFLYAWSTFVRAPQRHILGIISSTILIYSWIIFYGTEIHSYFSHVNRKFESETAFLTVVSSFLYVLLPVIVVTVEVRTSIQDTARSDYKNMLNETGSTSFAATPDNRGLNNGALHGRHPNSTLKLDSLFPNEGSVPRNQIAFQQGTVHSRYYLEDSHSETGTAFSVGESQNSFQHQPPTLLSDSQPQMWSNYGDSIGGRGWGSSDLINRSYKIDTERTMRPAFPFPFAPDSIPLGAMLQIRNHDGRNVENARVGPIRHRRGSVPNDVMLLGLNHYQSAMTL